MLPETATSTYCVMAFHSLSSTAASSKPEAFARSRWHMTRPQGQPAMRIVYSADPQR